MKKKKVLVGMSGGVDSSVAAAILNEQGYDVTGVYVEAYNEPGCRADQDQKDALFAALLIGIKFEKLDYRELYKQKVIKYFLDDYQAGRTPNPDIVCNKEVKFGLLLDYAMSHGYEYLATGHYARVSKQRTGESRQALLQRPVDLSKDQTYFLWQVGRDKLEHLLFPLGELTKTGVRSKARELGLANWDKPDSMGVCMIGELDVAGFLHTKLGEKKGLVRFNNHVVGEHKGLWFFTPGQRVGGKYIKLLPNKLKEEGLNTTLLPVLYVVGKNPATNEIIIGMREECDVNKFSITNYQLPIDNDRIVAGDKHDRVYVRIRNLGELTQVESWTINNDVCELSLKESIFAPAPGQSAVFYNQEGMVIGGGIIVGT